MSEASLFRADPSLAPLAAFEARGAAVRRATPKPARPRVLLLSALISMPYRVMRVAVDAGAEIYVLGNAMSQCLAHSRFCKKFVATHVPITGERDPALAAEIERWSRWFGIDMVLPGDVQATRALIAARDLIETPLFPLPTLPRFDQLNNKWFFTRMCDELGILTPQSRAIADAEQLRAELVAGRIALPAIAKPINHDGGMGVIRLDPDNALAQTVKIDYGPIIVQEFIEGRDIGASIYCERGEIKAFIAHELRRATYRSLDDPHIYRALAKIAAHMGIDGVFNFDMRLAPDGTVYYLECNPRFFFKINLSMLAGVNFVRMGLNATGRAVTAPKQGAAVRMPKALA
ncbi:MAG: ATP-grasp domain-containing protein, partial [Stellaceae bacterium]